MGNVAANQNSDEPNEVVGQIAASLPMPIVAIGPDQRLLFANPAAEHFFAMGSGLLRRQKLADLIPFGSPLLQLMAQALERNASVGERDVDLSTPRHGERLADVVITPMQEPDGGVV